MWISVFMSHFSCSLQESSWESQSYHHFTRIQMVWIGLPLCINPFPRKLPDECWPICCPKSIRRKANTVENDILRILDCSSRYWGSDSLLNRICLIQNVWILGYVSPVTHQKSAQKIDRKRWNDWLEEMKLKCIDAFPFASRL